MRLTHAALLVCLLFTTAAPAADKAELMRMLPKSGEVVGLPLKEGGQFWKEWRDGATRWVELMSQNEELQKKVGEPMDWKGLKCAVWQKIADLADESLKAAQVRAKAQNRELTQWLVDAPGKARKKANEFCSDPGEGPGYRTREKNLGLRYLEEYERSKKARQALAQDEELLGHFGRLAGAIQDFLKALPARAGAAVPATGMSVPIIDPRLFLRKDCRPDCAT
ncbi:hypothetical protein [Comamonas sp. JC664]|uniref:hypothetical protein n=1 Tax=Comamonas sp. JC664 TaxID=2801917 RepID=UPI00174D297A|nr:hypothetical protein [Comamonas sp. JC664]MBL0698971.1 hypothetical protein [Comamonas sp. JC664]GHG79851.1 hypothetical protein GCM10012319_32130 [Comamonas sp. KCTC 72670]